MLKPKFVLVILILLHIIIINGKQSFLHNFYCNSWNLPVIKYKKTGSDYKGILMLYLTSAADDERNSDELVITDYTCYVHFHFKYEFKNCFKCRKYLSKNCFAFIYLQSFVNLMGMLHYFCHPIPKTMTIVNESLFSQIPIHFPFISLNSLSNLLCSHIFILNDIISYFRSWLKEKLLILSFYRLIHMTSHQCNSNTNKLQTFEHLNNQKQELHNTEIPQT